MNYQRGKFFQELDGIEFVAQIDVSADQDGNDRNEIRYAITKEDKEYEALMKLNGKYKISKNTVEPEDELVSDEIPF